MGATADIILFDEEGKDIDAVRPTFPDYLDWMPIEAKIFWFKARGFGHPSAKRLLMTSQGERRLVELDTPLAKLDWKQLKEQEHGLEQRTRRYIAESGIRRTPRNQ